MATTCNKQMIFKSRLFNPYFYSNNDIRIEIIFSLPSLLQNSEISEHPHLKESELGHSLGWLCHIPLG